MSPRDEDLLARLDDALRGEPGEIELSAWAGRTGTTRFAASQVTQSTEVEQTHVQARVAEEGRVGAARVGSLAANAIRDAIARARAIARALPPDANFPGFDDGKAEAPPVDGAWDEATAAARADARAAELARALTVTDGAKLEAAGLIASADAAQAVATSAGSRRAYRFTTHKIDLIAAEGRASGWAGAYGPRPTADPASLAAVAAEHAALGRDPIELPPGRYDVLLEPKAVAEALEWLSLASLSARPLEDGSSCLAGHLGQSVTSDRITLYDDPRDPDPIALRAPFDGEGTPTRRVDFIARGIARAVVTDRASARRLGLPPTGHATHLLDEIPWDSASPQHLHLAPGPDTAADLLSRIERGLLVTRFHYVNGLLDTRRALMTGMTRDGLLLVENGKITRGVRNLRWTESLLDALSRVDGIGRERRAVAAWWSTVTGSAIVTPALLLRNFHFTGSTR